MIRKLLILALATTWLCACSMSSHAGKVDTHGLDTAQVVERVNEIYNDVFHHYELMAASGGFKDRLVGIKPPAIKYCTHDWNDWVRRVTSYDATHGGDGMEGFFEADYWIMGQDWGDLALSDVQVMSMTDSTAVVQLNLHNLGSVTALRLDLRQEDGAWKIDNFIDVKNDIDWKTNMKEYLAGEMANE